METRAAITLNIDKICRVCLQEKEDTVSIFSFIFIQEIPYRLSDVILRISNMKIEANDGLPQIICKNCAATACIANNFYLSCNRSSEILRDYLDKVDKRCKQEPIEGVGEEEVENDFILTNNCKEEYIDEVTGSRTVSSEAKQVNNQAPVGNNAINNIEEDEIEIPPDDVNDKESDSSPNEKSSDEFVKLYSCNICNRVYNAKTSLTFHMKIHSSSPEYKCKFCGMSFPDHSKLLKHRRNHNEKQPHVCKICGKKYVKSTTLTAHMRVHTGQRPYLCTVCGKSFRQAPDLKYHMRTHSKERRYMCSFCGKTMKMQCHLVVHMRSHTGDRPYQCKDCPKNFASSATLKRHSLTHTNLRPYKCNVCDKSFNQSSALKTHSKIHSDDRKHICSVCNKRFIQAAAMKTHMLTHTASNTQ